MTEEPKVPAGPDPVKRAAALPKLALEFVLALPRRVQYMLLAGLLGVGGSLSGLDRMILDAFFRYDPVPVAPAQPERGRCSGAELPSDVSDERADMEAIDAR